MKKFIIAMFIMAGSFGIANAQTKEKTKATTAVTSTTTKSAPAATTTKVKTTKSTPSTTTTTTDIHKAKGLPSLKKDGTPDMRYKENKVTAKTTVVGPVKKDGTADMRYKKNKVEKK